MSLTTRARRWYRGLIGHVQAPTPKHVENSNRGDKRAKRRRKKGNDLDLLITAADPHCPYVDHPEHLDGKCLGHVVNTHWPHPMLRDGFRDPKRQISPHRPVKKLTLPQVLRLVAGRLRKYHIRTIEQALTHCAEIGIAAVLEPKGDPRFDQERVWLYIFAVAQQVGATVSIRALPENASALEVARRAAARTGQHVEAWQI